LALSFCSFCLLRSCFGTFWADNPPIAKQTQKRDREFSGLSFYAIQQPAATECGL
jgi:hypothetical protein